MKQRFTEHQRQKLVKLGFQKMSGTNVVKYGHGSYSKRFGFVHITLQIRNHLIERFAFSIPYQGTDFIFATQCCKDQIEAIEFVKGLGYFDDERLQRDSE